MELSFQEITEPADLDADLENVNKMLGNQITTYGIGKRYVRKDGNLIWANLTVSLAREPNGQPKYFISVIEEISQRKGDRRSPAAQRGPLSGTCLKIRRFRCGSRISQLVKHRLDTLQQEGVTDFRAYLQDRPDLVAELIALVKNVTFNQASLDLYGARSTEDLMVALDRLVPPEAHQLFVDEFVWIAEGRTSFSWEGINRKFSGEIIDVRLHWSAVPGHEDTLDRVLVSIEDITASRRT